MTPVVLVHGIWKDSSAFQDMSRYLWRSGITTAAIDLKPNDGSVGIEELAKQLASFIDQLDSPEVDLVGFSMGGLVSRYYLQRLGGSERVRKFITIGTPNHGTLVARFSSLPASQQMRVNSPWISDLNSDFEMLLKHDVVSIWTPYDLMVIPRASGMLPVGRTMCIPTLIHHLMLSDERVLRAVKDILQ